MHCIFLASVLNIHFAIIGNAVLYFVAGLQAVVMLVASLRVVAFFLGVVCSLLYYFVAVVVEYVALLRGALLRDAPLRCILPFGVLLLELLLV